MFLWGGWLLGASALSILHLLSWGHLFTGNIFIPACKAVWPAFVKTKEKEKGGNRTSNMVNSVSAKMIWGAFKACGSVNEAF